MKGYAVTGLAVALLVAGVRADDKADKARAVKEEHKRLDGTWEVVRSVADGKRGTRPREKMMVTLKDGKYTVRAGDETTAEGTFTIDPTTSPKSVDIRPATGPDKGQTLRGIYEVKGDTRRICFAQPGEPRPRAFESEEGSGHTLVTYKRVKAR